MTEVFFNGAFVAKDAARVSPDDRGFLFGDGVYEVVRAYGGRFFEMDAHLDRLARGLAELEYPDPGVDLPAVLHELLQRNGLAADDAIAYLQITRGAPAARAHAWGDARPELTIYATAFPYRPKADPAAGVAVITVPDVRWARCDIKTVNLLANCMAQQRARAAGAFEAILVRDGVALESSASSFFAVIQGQVRTAPRSNYILPSITRATVLRLCATNGIPCAETPVFEHELARASELFLAGTTLEVLPIVHVDGRPVGTGRPGPVAARLLELLRQETRSGAAKTPHAVPA